MQDAEHIANKQDTVEKL